MLKFGIDDAKKILGPDLENKKAELKTENKGDISYYRDAISKCCFLDKKTFEQACKVLDFEPYELESIVNEMCQHAVKDESFLESFKWFYQHYEKYFDRRELENAMINASVSGNIGFVKYCLEEIKLNVHIDLDAPLRQAARYGHLELVKYLVENHQPHLTAYRSYALNFAIRNGHNKIAKYLESLGCKPRDDFCLVGHGYCNPYGDKKGGYFCECNGHTTWKDVEK